MFRREINIEPILNKLRQYGFAEEQISILTQESAIRKSLGCEPISLVPKYASWGVVFGIATYGVFGLAAVWCQCNLLSFEQTYGIVSLSGALLAGAFIGGFIGCFLGVAQSEEDSRPYVQGVRMGGKVIIVQADDVDIEKARNILSQENGHEIRIIKP
jgi:hypothetical protein